MRARRMRYSQMGEAISIEDAIALFAVIFLLFVLFLVPLINLDKAKTEQGQIDTFWTDIAKWLSEAPPTPTLAQPYLTAFGIDNQKVRITPKALEGFTYIEAFHPDSTITVVEHNIQNGSFISLVAQKKSEVVIFRSGQLEWSPTDEEWFTVSVNVDYGDKASSREMRDRYQQWTQRNRGL